MLRKLSFLIITIFLLTTFLLANQSFATTVDTDNNYDGTDNSLSTETSPDTSSSLSDTDSTTTTSPETASGVSVSSSGTQSQSLGLANILNIFLIVLGVLLIFLGIAIFIQIKK